MKGSAAVRDAGIVARVLAGETLQQVAEDYNLSRQRVSQIVRARCPGWDGDLRRRRRAEDRSRTSPECGDRGRPRHWTSNLIVNALRAASVDGHAPSLHWWATFSAGPSPSIVIGRFGSWNAACQAAGLIVTTGPSVHMVPDEELVAAVAKFLTDCGGGVRAYTVWARVNGAASPGSLRRRFGSWGAVKAKATASAERQTVTGIVAALPAATPSTTWGTGHAASQEAGRHFQPED